MLTSIVIVTHNSADAIRRCVDSIREHTEDGLYELIVIDNASSDGTPAYLHTLTDAQVVLSEDNSGFAAGCNQGLRLARGDYLLLLNPDTAVTEGWLGRLVAHAERHDDVGAVGPVSNGTGELQLDPLAETQFEDMEQLQDYARRVAKKNRGKSWNFHRLAGFCILVKREVFERVGELDERFGIGFYEDDDYCRRILEAGNRIVIARDVFIYHEGGVSFAGLAPGITGQMMLVNRNRYLAKWSDADWLTTMPEAELSQPAVSVIIATRDRPHLLRVAVSSVIDQTFDSFEVLVVNDGEGDLRSLLDEFGDERIQLLSAGGRGKSHALNVGIKEARGRFIAYLDDDDLYYPWHLQTLITALLNRPGYQLAYTDTVLGYCLTADDGHHVTTSEVFETWEYDRQELRDKNYIPNLAVMHTRSLIDQSGPYDEELPLYEDWDALRRFSAFTDMLHVPVITAEWHRHLNTRSRNEPAPRQVALREDTEIYIRGKQLPWAARPTVHDLVIAGEAAEGSNLRELAIKSYFAALGQDRLAFDAALGAARVLASLRQRQRIKSVLQNAIRSRPDLAEGYIAYAQELLRKRPSKPDVREAKSALEFSISVDPGRKIGVVYRLLADCYRRLGDRQTAKACREYAQRVSPRGRIGRFLGIWRREGLTSAFARAVRATAPELSRVVSRLESRGRRRSSN
ncbi:MAG TPA: glycosyltransferase [Dehalococcoidia bacterium]